MEEAVILIPTTTAARRSMHVRLRTNHTRTLCGQHPRYDIVRNKKTIVCGDCTKVIRKMYGLVNP